MGFLDPGNLIVARLKAKISAASLTIDVFTAVDGGAILDTPLAKPAVYVIFDGYGPTKSVGAGMVQQIEQTWAAVIALRHVSGANLGTGLPIDAEVSPVIDVVLSALCGWRASKDFDEMRMSTGGGPVYSSGYAYFTFRFTTRTVVRGAP